MTKKRKAGLIIGAVLAVLAIFDLTVSDESIIRTNLEPIIVNLMSGAEDVAPVASE